MTDRSTTTSCNCDGYYPSSSPPFPKGAERDIHAAMDYLTKAGAKRIFVLGSSMGGFIALRDLKSLEKRTEFAGLIIMSAYDSDASQSSTKPKLFIAAEDDKSYYSKTQACFTKASTPKQMIAYRTGGHGQSLFNKHGERLLDQIAAFMEANKLHGAKKSDRKE